MYQQAKIEHRKSLFDEHFRYTQEGIDLDNRAREALSSLVMEFLTKGFSPREIAHIISLTALDFETQAILEYRGTVQGSLADGSLALPETRAIS